jgi:hypothetical protein
MIEARGGMQTIKSLLVFRLMLFWYRCYLQRRLWQKLTDHRVDMIDCSVTDIPPRFELPNDFTGGFTNSHRFVGLNDLTAFFHTELIDLADISPVLSAIADMAQFVKDTVENTHWQDIWFMSLRFMPILHQLLSLPRTDLGHLNHEPGIVIREAIRLACLIFLSIMKRRFHISPDGIELNRNRVMKLLQNYPVDWFTLLNLRLWVLVIAGLVADGRERAWYIDEISNTMKQIEVTTWKEALSIVRGIIWVDELLNNKANALGLEVEKVYSNLL